MEGRWAEPRGQAPCSPARTLPHPHMHALGWRRPPLGAIPRRRRPQPGQPVREQPLSGCGTVHPPAPPPLSPILSLPSLSICLGLSRPLLPQFLGRPSGTLKLRTGRSRPSPLLPSGPAPSRPSGRFGRPGRKLGELPAKLAKGASAHTVGPQGSSSLPPGSSCAKVHLGSLGCGTPSRTQLPLQDASPPPAVHFPGPGHTAALPVTVIRLPGLPLSRVSVKQGGPCGAGAVSGPMK